jgi:putative intracellular protease/amidase
MRRVLVVLSAAKELDLKGGKSVATGYFLSELYIPLKVIEKAGYRPTFTNPTGESATNMDPMSDHMVWYGSPGEFHRAKQWLQDQLQDETEGSLKRPVPFSAWGEANLLPFAGVFVPGGHAPMIDLHNNQNLGYIINHFHRHNKPTGLICHGPVALLSTNLAISMDQNWPYIGYRMTAYSNKEEIFNEILWRDRLHFHVEDGLKDAGGGEKKQTHPSFRSALSRSKSRSATPQQPNLSLAFLFYQMSWSTESWSPVRDPLLPGDLEKLS